MRHPIRVAAALLLAALPASAADIVVDAAGSGFTNINQAMLVAQPGDRILVMPGAYPPFHFSRGVSVIGMGDDPGDVLIGRCDLHVTVPAEGYDAKLSNLTLGDGKLENGLALSGNESPPGAVTVHGVRIAGGLFLGGGADGFHLHMQNASVDPAPGQGFLGAAVHLGGAPGFSAELVDVAIHGWDADPAAGVPAGIGLRLAGGMRARLAGCEVTGGDGLGVLPSAGASALASWAALGPVSVRLDGATLAAGGAGVSGGAGGHGVALSGVLELGSAQVLAGAGSPPGQPFSGVTPVALPAAGFLQLAPSAVGGQLTGDLQSGDVLDLFIMAPSAKSVILVSLALDTPPANGPFVPLAPPLLVALDNSLSAMVPVLGGTLELPAVFAYAQAFVRPDAGGPLVPSNVQALNLHFLPIAP